MMIVIMHQTITNHDAIGNDIEIMYNILNQKHTCKAYAQNRLNSNLEYIEENELTRIMDAEENLIIYHHSVNWEYGERLIKKIKAKLIFRYHNITPPEFFKPYNDFHYEQCDKGRKQTNRLVNDYKNALWIVDSIYNGEDLKNVDQSQISVCPPFNKIKEWARGIPDEEVLKTLLNDKRINLLFVGRVAPNKGHLFMIDILQNYCVNFGTDIILRIIGKFDEGLPGYNQEIENRISKYGLENNIEFIGEINDALLTSYYLGSDIFLCTSEHEGFCVPIPEAQYFDLPVIARATSAITETIGKNQIVLDESIKKYAAAIHILNNNNSYYKFIQANGLKNFNDRFTNDKITRVFQTIFKEKLGVNI